MILEAKKMIDIVLYKCNFQGKIVASVKVKALFFTVVVTVRVRLRVQLMFYKY
jgi:hypothetical protein